MLTSLRLATRKSSSAGYVDEIELNEARTRALNLTNGTWTRPKDDEDRRETKYTKKEPVERAGQINLIRAIVDESEDLIQADKTELEELKRRQEFLVNRIAAYEELQTVGNKHFSKLTIVTELKK